MKGSKLLLVCCIAAFVAFAFAAEETVILQNGLNGYAGCTDSYGEMSKGNNESSTNYGNAADLMTQYENYES